MKTVALSEEFKIVLFRVRSGEFDGCVMIFIYGWLTLTPIKFFIKSNRSSLLRTDQASCLTFW